jgi:hypothetical protein
LLPAGKQTRLRRGNSHLGIRSTEQPPVRLTDSASAGIENLVLKEP